MKKTIPVLTLIIGLGLGWGIASYQSRCALQEMQQTWTPEFRELVRQSVSIGKTMTENERREMLKSAVELGAKMVADGNSQVYARAKQSLLMKKLIESGKVDDALSYSESWLERFVEQYDRGDFENDMNEDLAGELAEAIKSSNNQVDPSQITPGDENKL